MRFQAKVIPFKYLSAGPAGGFCDTDPLDGHLLTFDENANRTVSNLWGAKYLKSRFWVELDRKTFIFLENLTVEND